MSKPQARAPLPFRLLHGTVLGEVFEVALAVREVERQRPFEVLADQPVEEELEPLALESYRTTPRDKGSRIKRQHTRPMGATWKGGSRGCRSGCWGRRGRDAPRERPARRRATTHRV